MARRYFVTLCLSGAVLIGAAGCCTKEPSRVSQSGSSVKRAPVPAHAQVYTTETAAKRFDKWRRSLEEYKQAERDRYHRMLAKRIAEQHAFPPELPDIKRIAEPAAGRGEPRTAADRLDAWKRRNAELELAEQLREVRVYQLKTRHYLSLPPEWVEERSAR